MPDGDPARKGTMMAPRSGWKHTPESRAKMSERQHAAHRRRSPEAEAERRRKIAAGMRGKPKSAEHRRRIAEGRRRAWDERRRLGTVADTHDGSEGTRGN